MKRFGVMLDCSRNAVMKPQEVKNFALTIKSLGYNMIQLYTEDTYEIEGEPYFGYMRGRYTYAELKDIVAYCNEIGVEMIPCIQTLAHLRRIFHWPVYSDINDYEDILFVGEERTYELIENMFKAVKECFTSEYVHIGMDESWMLGLGQYLHKHGIQSRYEILKSHLERVLDIAKKYGLKPIMWSDMFFRLANKGMYYLDNPSVSEEVKNGTPKEVGLVYWDYYNSDEKFIENMMRAHLTFDNEVWFAGGAWTWTGFASGNKKALETMFPAMEAAQKCGIENIFLTMWGDNGKETSFYSVLPALYAIRRYYDGERDMEKIKEEFKGLTGEEYDALAALDEPNYVGENDKCEKNVSKQMLFSDPFNGFLDSTVKEGVTEEYKELAKKLSVLGQASKYGYIFESSAALCKALSVKYDLGVRTRKAYQRGEKSALLKLIDDYEEVLYLVEDFYGKFEKLWLTENKPHGFDVQDLRFGGLKQRLISCKKRLAAYVRGEIESIPELEEKLLCYFGDEENFRDDIPVHHDWLKTITVNTL